MMDEQFSRAEPSWIQIAERRWIENYSKKVRRTGQSEDNQKRTNDAADDGSCLQCVAESWGVHWDLFRGSGLCAKVYPGVGISYL